MGLPRISYYEPPTDVELSRSPLPWRVEAGSAALLIHDMQNYFLRPYESDVFVDRMVANIEAIRQRCHTLRIPTFYSAQLGGQSRDDRGLLIDFWGVGMPPGDGQRIVRGLEPVEGRDQMLVKHRYSAFAKSDLLSRLKELRRTQLIICGVYAHLGCQVTAIDAFMADIKPFVVSDALGDFSRERHEMALHYVAHSSGKVLSTARLLDELSEARPEPVA